ncbi:hypothetical protein [Halorussus halophilus]|uniref:hypothetical protein n=1 Tax=Halorussus halophilus TaxID=2650975 RepID=UPI001300CD2C|nr:hypothetical protein [Halorussus halophilus]
MATGQTDLPRAVTAAAVGDPRPISQREVVREWLRMECQRGAIESDALGTLTDREALDELLERKPGAAAFVWRESPTWYELSLDRETFERLHVVEGPENLRWRALSPDGTVLGAARRVANEDPDRLAAETGVDVRKVLRFSDQPPGGPLVLSTRQGCSPVTVADGNHRAVAQALGLLAGEDYRPRRAYLAIGANPVLRPLAERTCGLVRRILSRL